MHPAILNTNHFVCVRCRRCVKGPRFLEITSRMRQGGWSVRPMMCSQCGGDMPCLGKNFTPPRRKDEKQWKKLEYLISQGWPRANWQTTPAMSLRDVQETKPPHIEGGAKRLMEAKKRRSAQKEVKKTLSHKARKARLKKQQEGKEWASQCQDQEQIVSNLKND